MGEVPRLRVLRVVEHAVSVVGGGGLAAVAAVAAARRVCPITAVTVGLQAPVVALTAAVAGTTEEAAAPAAAWWGWKQTGGTDATGGAGVRAIWAAAPPPRQR